MSLCMHVCAFLMKYEIPFFFFFSLFLFLTRLCTLRMVIALMGMKIILVLVGMG